MIIVLYLFEIISFFQREKLTFEEFQEMLNRVHKVPLYEMDPRLVPFVHMSAAWYQGLAQVLNNSYTDHFKRCFVNPENSAEQHYVSVIFTVLFKKKSRFNSLKCFVNFLLYTM